MVYGVILAGGRGERFWPLSRINRPKQFLKLTSDKMMLEETIDRVLPLIPMENVRIVTNESMRDIIFENLDSIKEENILTETEGKNTCLAIVLAAVHLMHVDPKAVMVVLSADHLIRPEEKLLDILKVGIDIATSENKLITIGVVPTRPETGYGYIKMGDLYRQDGEHVVYRVEAFTEKPKAAIASQYYYSHKYLWNSGMFIWSANAILEAVKISQPNLYNLLEKYKSEIGTDNEFEARRELYKNAESISIDFAVLEQAENVLAIKGDIVWDDVGGWRALERYKHKDGDNNVILGDTITVDTFETTVYNDGDGIIACFGVSDMVIVRSGEITMVVHKSRVNDIKKLLNKIADDETNKKYL